MSSTPSKRVSTSCSYALGSVRNLIVVPSRTCRLTRLLSRSGPVRYVPPSTTTRPPPLAAHRATERVRAIGDAVGLGAEACHREVAGGKSRRFDSRQDGRHARPAVLLRRRREDQLVWRRGSGCSRCASEQRCTGHGGGFHEFTAGWRRHRARVGGVWTTRRSRTQRARPPHKCYGLTAPAPT